MVMTSKSDIVGLKVLNDLQLAPEIESRLDLLVQAARILNLDDPSLIGFSQSLNGLSNHRLSLKLSLHRAEYVEQELRTHLAELEAELSLLHHWTTSLADVSAVDSSTEPTETIERRRQGVIRKAKEYQTQLAQVISMPAESAAFRITDLTHLQEQNREREKEIRRRRKKVDTFRGLPANPDLARIALSQAIQNLKELTRVREGLLGRMIDTGDA